MSQKDNLLRMSDGIPATIVAAADEGEGRRFSMLAYTGGAMRVAGWYNPVVVDLTGMKIGNKSRPIFIGHSGDVDDIVGQTDKIAITGDNKLTAEGDIMGDDSPRVQRLLKLADRGFKWQASIGARADKIEFVEEGSRATANGREFKGPVIIARKSTLGEISFVPLGADNKTRALVAEDNPQETLQMDGQDNQKEQVTGTETGTQGGQEMQATAQRGSSTPLRRQDNGNLNAPEAIIEARRTQARLQKIDVLAARTLKEYPSVDLDALEKVVIEAKQDGWTLEATELAMVKLGHPRMEEPRSPQGSSGLSGFYGPKSNEVLAAGLLMACGVKDEVIAKDRDFGDRVAEEAWKLRHGGLHQVFAAALNGAGISAPHGGQALFHAVVENFRNIRAGFSTVNLPGILGTVGNKLLLNSFTAVDATYERIAQQVDFNNFLTHTIYRLDHTGEFALVGSTGELKHGKLSESSYTNKLDTRGQMLTLSRQAIINDDLNALVQMYSMLGRKARIAVEKALYTELLESSDVFFTSGRGNLLASNALSVEALGYAEAAMLGMVDADGDPIYAAPSILLVPPARKFLADQLYTSARVNQDPASNTAQGEDNPFQGRFKVESSPYMALASMAGYSATTWYMLADPASLPAFQVAYLQGRRAPTIETADTEFSTLGIQMRCFFDFGVSEIDYRGCVKNEA